MENGNDINELMRIAHNINELMKIIRNRGNFSGMMTTLDRELVFMVNYDDDSVSVIETTEWAIIDTIPVGSNPIGIHLEPGGENFHVVSFLDDSLTVIEISTRTVIDIIHSTE